MSEFAKLKNTWNLSSSLKMSRWDPYPELRNQKDVYGNETKECYIEKDSKALNYKILDTTWINKQKYNL